VCSATGRIQVLHIHRQEKIKERKKLSFFYGNLTKKQLSNLFKSVTKAKGYFSKNVFSLLESRLDIVLYRSGLVKTINEARQLIKHEKIQVNEKSVFSPSRLIHPGDVISINKLNNDYPKLFKTVSKIEKNKKQEKSNIFNLNQNNPSINLTNTQLFSFHGNFYFCLYLFFHCSLHSASKKYNSIFPPQHGTMSL